MNVRVIFHVDMDAFFASVEQRDNPEYRGKPVIVGAPPDQRGVICAASYEARKFGVHSAMPSRQAGKLCPNGIFVYPRMEAYREESRAIMSILERYTSRVEKVSVDEAYIDLSENLRDSMDIDSALQRSLPLAHDIKDLIKSERGLTASIGIASNKFLAKLGSDFSKPNGLTLILEAEKVAFLRPLSVRAIHGVGPVTANELESINLRTIGDIQDTTSSLETILGSYAATLKRRAFGDDDRPLEFGQERKSISAEHTFAKDTEDRNVLRDALRDLVSDVTLTLNNLGVGALTVQIKVRYGDFRTLTRQIRLAEPVTSAREIFRLSCHLLAQHKLVTRPLRLLGIGVATFVPPAAQQQLQLPLGAVSFGTSYPR